MTEITPVYIFASDEKLIPLFIVLSLLAITSCDNNKTTALYTVTFDSDGGSYTPSTQYIKENGKVIEPKSPEKSFTRGFM